MSDSSDNFSGFWCSCEVVAATAQDTAEGAVVIAAGGAAGDPSEAAGAVRIFTGELRSGDSSDITTNRFW